MNLLTDNQVEIMSLIDRFGVVSSTQLIEFLKGDLSHVTIYNTRKKLLSLGFIAEQKIGKLLVLAIKPSGVEYLGSNLTPFTKVNMTLLQHQLVMNDCIIAMKNIASKKGQDFLFITERELRSEYLDQNFSQNDRRNTTKLKKVSDRIPDYVVCENGGNIAHEVELTQKSSKRYMEKMSRYKDEILNGRYRAVRYLCETDKIKQTIIDHAQRVGLDSSMLQLELIGRLIEFGKKE